VRLYKQEFLCAGFPVELIRVFQQHVSMYYFFLAIINLSLSLSLSLSLFLSERAFGHVRLNGGKSWQKPTFASLTAEHWKTRELITVLVSLNGLFAREIWFSCFPKSKRILSRLSISTWAAVCCLLSKIIIICNIIHSVETCREIGQTTMRSSRSRYWDSMSRSPGKCDSIACISYFKREHCALRSRCRG